MKCGVVTIHTGEAYKTLADITWTQNRELYAERHGYKAIVQTDNFNGMNLGFAKIHLLLETMKNSDVELLHWSGTDTMITNFSIPLDSFLYDGYHVVIATDFNGIQSDSFVIRNTIEGRAWLSMIMDNMPTYIKHPFLEQGVMMESYNQYKHIVKVVPQRYLNSYHYDHYKNKGAKNHCDAMGFSGQWQIGDFLLHMPDQPMHLRLEVFKDTIGKVIR